MGTPYGGTPIARLAVLGDLLSPLVPCGFVSDLTVTGAERWRQMIPANAQREVFFYTTQVSWYMLILQHPPITYRAILTFFVLIVEIVYYTNFIDQC